MILLLVSPRQGGMDLTAVLGERARDCLIVTTGSQRSEWLGARETVVVAEYRTDELVSAGLWLARRYGISRVVSFAEADVLAAAILRGVLDVRGQAPASAEAYRDKATMRSCIQRSGSVGPAWATVEEPADVVAFLRRRSGHAVVKPRRGSGSIGVRVIDSSDVPELPSSLPNHIVEEFVSGEMVHVDALQLDGEQIFALPAVYTELGCLAHLHDRGSGSALMDRTDPRHGPLVRALWEVVDALPAAPDLMLHAEFFQPPDGPPIFCEVAARLPGHPIPPMIDRALGINLRTLWLRHQAGEPIDVAQLRRRADQVTPVANYGLPPRRGTLLQVPNRAPSGCEDWVHDVVALARPGEIWDAQRYASRKSGDFVATWTVTADNARQLHERVERAARGFEAEVVFDAPVAAL